MSTYPTNTQLRARYHRSITNLGDAARNLTRTDTALAVGVARQNLRALLDNAQRALAALDSLANEHDYGYTPRWDDSEIAQAQRDAADQIDAEGPGGDMPVGLVEIAELLGVERATADQWRSRGVLPTPPYTVGGRPAWRRGEILSWAERTGRLGGSGD